MAVVFIVLVLFARETMQRSPGLLRPRFTLPPNSMGLFAASSMVFIGTWALGGFAQSFSSTLVSEHYLTPYGGAAITNLVVGLIPGEYSLYTILTGYVVLVVAMYAVMLALSARPYPKVDAQPVRIDGSE